MTLDISDEEVLATYPTARIDQDNVDHYRGRLQHRLLVNRCGRCGRWHQPPRSMCPNCWSTEVAATEVCGSGTLDLFTVLHLGTPIPGIDYQAGYLLGSVALVEQVGLRFTGPLIDVDAPCLGLPVEITWLERQGAPVPAFKAAKIS